MRSFRGNELAMIFQIGVLKKIEDVTSFHHRFNPQRGYIVFSNGNFLAHLFNAFSII